MATRILKREYLNCCKNFFKIRFQQEHELYQLFHQSGLNVHGSHLSCSNIRGINTFQTPPIQLTDTGSFFRLKEVSVKALGDEFNVIYAHAGPEDGEVIIAVHGSPASHKGFQNLAKPLVAEGYQVIVPNLPGMGWTQLPPSGCYKFSSFHKAQVIQGLAEALKFEKIKMLCGHSMGCHAILQVTRLPSLFAVCESFCFISSTGLRPHRAASPWSFKRRFFKMYSKMCAVPVVGPLLVEVSNPVMVKLGLKGRTKLAQVNSIREASTFDWEEAKEGVDILRQQNFPILLFHGDKDALVNIEIGRELVTRLGLSQDDTAYYREGKKDKHFKDSTMQRAVFVEGGDHSIFTNRVDVIFPEQLHFLKSLHLQAV